MKMLNIAVHNTGGLASDSSASTQHMTQKQVNDYHQLRWNFKSALGRYGGYNFFIDKSGVVTQFRKIGEETAAQFGHNFDTISICLAGNFSVMSTDRPTRAQELALVNLIDWCMRFGRKEKGIDKLYAVEDGTEFDLSVVRIYPHRLLQSGTECHGMKLDDSWAQDLYMRELGESTLKRYIAYLQQQVILLLKKKVRRVGSQDRSCEAVIG